MLEIETGFLSLAAKIQKSDKVSESAKNLNFITSLLRAVIHNLNPLLLKAYLAFQFPELYKAKYLSTVILSSQSPSGRST